MNAPVTLAAEGLPRRAFSVADVERMVEVGLLDPDERIELIGGELVPMAPKGARHEALKVLMNRAIIPLLGDAFFSPRKPRSGCPTTPILSRISSSIQQRSAPWGSSPTMSRW